MKNTVRVAACADLHCSRTSQGTLRTLFGQVAQQADVLVICGDFTDYGLPEEAQILAGELASVAGFPIVGVLGNHDYESGLQAEVQKILRDAGVIILDGDVCQVLGVDFAGVKGFGGGFGIRALEPWGEEAMKLFVREAAKEVLKLEAALARLGRRQGIALLHYAPIRETVEGEPLEILPFLGSSRLEEPINRYPVTAVFHGHAHHGRPEGHTQTGVPVFNVSMQLLSRTFPDRLPFRLIEIETANHLTDVSNSSVQAADERAKQNHNLEPREP